MTRARLAARRQCDVLSFEHGGIAYVGKVSRFATGELAEVFLDARVKSGSAVQHMAQALAVMASLALQRGAPEAELTHALPRLADGSAADPLGKLLDLLGKESG